MCHHLASSPSSQSFSTHIFTTRASISKITLDVTKHSRKCPIGIRNLKRFSNCHEAYKSPTSGTMHSFVATKLTSHSDFRLELDIQIGSCWHLYAPSPPRNVTRHLKSSAMLLRCERKLECTRHRRQFPESSGSSEHRCNESSSGRASSLPCHSVFVEDDFDRLVVMVQGDSHLLYGFKQHAR